MKTPDEIKKGLEFCLAGPCPGAECPYYEKELFRCGYFKSKDALAYIQQLETKCHQLERERDAAVADLTQAKDCDTCRYNTECKTGKLDCYGCNVEECPCWACQYEWRGVKEE